MANPARSAATPGRDRAILLASLAVLILPIVFDLAISDSNRVFGYLAIDFFYYETIARNYLTHGFATFDGEYATNGFHPVWQYTLVLLAAAAAPLGLSQPAFFALVLVVGLVLVAASLVLLARAFVVSEGKVSPLLPWTVPGIFALLTSPLYPLGSDFERYRISGGERPVVGTLWHDVNGMETGIVLAAFFGAVRILASMLREQDPRRLVKLAISCGAVLGVLALARLDHAIFSVALPTALLFDGSWTRARVHSVVIMLSVVACAIAGYVAWNYVGFGAAVPVSGSVKSSFPLFTADNIVDLFGLFVPGRTAWVYDLWRLAQELLPPLFSVTYLAATARVRVGPVRFELRDATTALDRILVASVPGVLGLGAYNFLYVRSDFQGHWYFPVSIALCSVFAIKLAERGRLGERLRKLEARLGLWIAASIALCSAFFGWAHYRTKYNDDIADFYLREAAEIQAAYAHDDPPRFIEFYDALFASATAFPTMNGYGLVVDRDAAAARKRGLDAIFELAAARGYDRIVSFNLDASALPERPSRRDLLNLLGRYISEEALSDFKLALEYRSADGRHVIVRVVPKRGRRSRSAQGT